MARILRVPPARATSVCVLGLAAHGGGSAWHMAAAGLEGGKTIRLRAAPGVSIVVGTRAR